MAQTTLAILGAGVWGRTLGELAGSNGHRVRFWSRSGGESLPGVISSAEILLSAVSMKGVRPMVEQVRGLPLSNEAIIVTATKGLDPETTLTPSQIWQQAFPDRPVVVLAGPNLSKEIQQGLPAATVVASKNVVAAQRVQAVFSGSRFRVYANKDPLGVELGGTLKNVMAIAAGTCDGLGLGTNAKAALLTRGLAEIIRIGTHWGAQAETFYGLSGLGDILATCNSPLSRNYQVGYQLATGGKLPEILANLEGTAEGVNTTEVLIQAARTQGIYVPIACEVYRLLKGEITPGEAVRELMLRESKPE
uniref:Glycerol-3-phosphate dehydrogenase [NAD(P)+] n=1 Tax=Planktothricoides sp. SpSt-374 TaxID=2282167 RepID=A0A7C3ZHJ4_9CYAN